MTQGTSNAVTGAPLDAAAHLGAGHACTYLEWDSEFFGIRVARLNNSRLSKSNANEALTWCAENRIDCLYLLADAEDTDTGRIALQNNFAEVDVRMTLARPLIQEDQRSPWSTDSRVRLACAGDLASVQRLARTLHHDTRFYFDRHFDRSKCDLLYETWIRKSILDSTQTVFVPHLHDQPVGYIACHLHNDQAQIGLLGVGGSHAGQGLGKALVHRFLSWAAQHEACRATVVTQARNSAARGLYQACGFRPLSMQRWYHRWFTNSQNAGTL